MKDDSIISIQDMGAAGLTSSSVEMASKGDLGIEINLEKVGKSFKVLIDRGDKNNYFGRTEFDSPEVDNEVIIPVANSHLRIGDFYNVEIINAREYDLLGKIK